MGFLDNAKAKLTKAVDQHGDKISQGLDKAGELADKKTKGKYSDKIEGGLGKAKDEFALISPHEHTLLERIHEDRHLCAHPAWVLDTELFRPTGEAVRAHIVHAVQAVLSQPPVQVSPPVLSRSQPSPSPTRKSAGA